MAAPEFNFTYETINHALKHHPLDECVGQRGDATDWAWLSTKEFNDYVNKLAAGFIEMGLAKGTKIAIAAYRNRWEWTAVDLACSITGMISIPVYPTISSDDYIYIFGQSEVSYGFVGKDDLYDKFETAGKVTPSYKKTFVFDEHPSREHWSTQFSEHTTDIAAKIKERQADIKSDDLMTIIYTSGTTGKPKGVMLSHRNICSAMSAASERLPVGPGDTVLSFLPLCHIFERTASLTFIANGCQVAFTGTDNLGGPDGDLQSIKPHFFTTVPRLLEKVYEKIYAKGEELTGVKRKLFFWALNLTDDYEYLKPLSGISGFFADKLIFSKWREALGGRMKAVVTGAAPCPSKILRVFSAAGIPVREAYGLTETSPGLTINEPNPQGSLIGTVGPVVKDVELRLDLSGDYNEGEGEILAHGPNVMLGYYKRPDANAEVFTEIDGKRWFRTGDIGTFVKGPGGKEYLKITDRKKELLKTSGGKYVAPAPIESKFKEEFLVEQIMVVGDSRKFVSALIVPAEDALKKWCEDNQVPFNSFGDAIQQEAVINHYQSIVNRLNPQFSHIEQIKKFSLVTGPWDVTHPDGSIGELTPTMKLKRRIVAEKYASLIDGLYA